MTRESKRVLTLSRAIDRFLIDFEDTRGATPATLDTYRWVLEQMGNELGWDRDPLQIQPDDLLDVVGRWRRLSTSSRAGRISAMRTFFKWLSQRYKIEDISRDLNRPRKQRPARKRLTRDDVERLMRAAKTDRDKLIVYLLAMTGIRKGDLMGLRWRDVNLRERTLIIRLGKGRKGREVPLPMSLVSFLNDVESRLKEAGDYHPDDYVCPFTIDHAMPTGGHALKVDRQRQMGPTAAYKTIHRLAAAGGVGLPCSPHDLRRYYADVFLEANPGDLFRLQAALGHADIGTTRMYLKDADMPRVKEAVDNIDFATPPPVEAPDHLPVDNS